MAIPDAIRLIVESSLVSYIEQKIPPHVRNRVRLSYRFRGNTVTLLEHHPGSLATDDWTDIVIARFRYNPGGNNWTLYWADRNSRWHRYIELEPTGEFDALLQEVNEDPTGIFWG